VRRHYQLVATAVEQLEADILPQIYSAAEQAPGERDPNAPTAVLLVNGFSGLGLATLMMIPRLFGRQFRNVVFVRVGEVDSSLLKGPEEVTQVEQQVADDLLEYCRLAEHLGFHAQTRTGLGAEVVTELRRLCLGCPRVSPARLFCGPTGVH
jgi:hypothetical protein